MSQLVAIRGQEWAVRCDGVMGGEVMDCGGLQGSDHRDYGGYDDYRAHEGM